MNRRVPLTNAAVMLVARMLAEALNLALFVLVSRRFGPEGVGLYSYGFALAAFVFAAANLSVEQYGVRAYQLGDARARNRILAELLGAQLWIAALAAIALPAYLHATEADATTWIIVAALSLFQLCNAIAGALFVPAFAEQQMTASSLAALACRSVSFAIAAIVLLADWGSLPLALLAFPASSVLYLAVGLHSARIRLGKVRVQLSPASVARTLRSMRSFATVDIVGQLLAKVGVILLTLHAGERAAGVFATGWKFVELAFLPLWFVGVATYPRMCRAYLEGSADFSKQSTALVLGAIAMAVLVVLLCSQLLPLLLVPLLGARFAGTESTIAAMSAVAFFFGIEMALGRVLYARGEQARRARSMAIGAVLCVAMSLVSIPLAGIHGAIAASAAAYLVIDVLYAVTVLRARTPSRPKSRDEPAVPTQGGELRAPNQP